MINTGKITALVLCVILALAPCAIAETADGELAAAVLSCREQLGIGDDYEEFTSDLYRAGGLFRYSFSWSGSNGDLYVTCGRDGTVYEYNRSDNESGYTYDPFYSPAFPNGGRDNAKQAAEAFLACVLPEPWGWKWDEDAEEGILTGTRYSYGFSAVLTVNGYETDYGIYVSVRASDGTVTSYSRYDSYTDHTVKAVPAQLFDAAAAKQLLAEGFSARLHYYDADGKTEKQLCWRILRDDPSYVDAGSGEPVGTGVTAAATSDRGEYPEEADDASAKAMGGYTLTEYELAGIEETEGLMNESGLDAAARAYEEFGLDAAFTLHSVRIFRNADGEGYTARLEYSTAGSDGQGAQDKIAVYGEDEAAVVKTVELDAADGHLLGLMTGRHIPYSTGEDQETNAFGEEKCLETARAFLNKYYPEDFLQTQSSLVSGKGTETLFFRFTRCVNDALYDANYYMVGINSDTLTVDEFGRNWEEEAVFAPADGIIASQKAVVSALNHYDITLRYASIPKDGDDTATSFDTVLVYALKQDAYFDSVDAYTGEPIRYDPVNRTYAYTDIADSGYALEIEKLAHYGIGFAGGRFLPQEKATWHDALVLLLQADGMAVDQDADWQTLCMHAFWKGLSCPYAEDDPVTSFDLAKLLVNGSGYGKAAVYEDIFRNDFADAAEIPSGGKGIAAIANAMGFLEADAEGRLNPGMELTREQTAHMLYRFLDR